MKIGFFTTVGPAATWGWGGSEDLWCLLARRCAENGFQVGAALRFCPIVPRLVQDLQRLGCSVHWHGRALSFAGRALRKLRLWQERRFDWLDDFRPNLAVISQNTFADGFDEAQACRSRRIPYVLIVHIGSEFFWPGDEELERLCDCYRHAAASWFVSHAALAMVQEQLAIRIPNAKVVRNPFRVRYEAAPPWPEETTCFRLACVGRLTPMHKGQDLLVEVLRMPKWRERELSVSLFGGGNNERALKRSVELHGLSSVRFGGHTAEIEQVWASHHALILPSRCEGLPLALVEAMLCGRISIVTDVGGNKELLEDNVTGFVAAWPKVEALDEALERAWQQRNEWRSMGVAAAECVRRQIPHDPIGVLFQEIEALVK